MPRKQRRVPASSNNGLQNGPPHDRSGPRILANYPTQISRLDIRVLRFSQNQFEGHLFLTAHNGHANGVARLVLVHDPANVPRISDLLAVDGDDEVAAD